MWKDLSMRERAALMRVAIKNGIYGLEEIRNSYNSFAKGGPIDIGKEQRQRYEAGLQAVSTEDSPIIFDYNEEARKLAELEKQQVKELNRIPEIIELENKGIKRYNNSYGKYFIPHIKDKEIKLTNAGSMTGTKLSTNVLDSLYHYSKKVDIPLVDAMGLPAQESTFGAGYNHVNHYKNDESGYNPVVLLSDWAYAPPLESDWNPYYYDNPILRFQPKESQEELNAIENFNKAYKDNSDDAYYYSKLLNVLGNKNKLDFYKNNKKGLKKLVDKYDENYPPIQHAFELFKSGKYNIGDPDYKNKVRRKGNEVINSPEFKEWAKKNNIKL